MYGALEVRKRLGAPPARRSFSKLIQTFHVWLPSLRRCRGDPDGFTA